MPLETFKRLAALADSGATVYFERFQQWDSPGWKDWGKKQEEYRDIYNAMRQNISITDPIAPIEFKRGKGRLTFDGPGEFLADENAVREPMTDFGLSFVRRSFDGGWNYFIANRGTNAFDDVVMLGHDAKSAAIFDPMTGRSGIVSIQRVNYDESFFIFHVTNHIHSAEYERKLLEETEKRQGHPVWVHLQLQPGESIILRVFADRKIEGPAWDYWQTNGASAEISGDWTVKFLEGGPTLPPDFQTAKLASWTTQLGTEAFAGTAKYEITFDAPANDSRQYYLDLGDVRQSARVKLNGKDYGTLITAPFRVVVDNLKPTGNKLEVEVTNVSANRIRDLDRRGVPWKIFKDANVLDVNYQPFNAADWPVTDSGLLGPVTLTPITSELTVAH